MASAEEIKARIGSIRQTKKVTDAMYMISSVKMRRAKREVISTEPYFNALKEQISDLFLYIPETNNRYFRVLLPEGQTFRRRGLLYYGCHLRRARCSRFSALFPLVSARFLLLYIVRPVPLCVLTRNIQKMFSVDSLCVPALYTAL